jgi:hypothetical protein
MVRSEQFDLFELMEERRKESKQEHQLLHERVSNMKDELLTEMKALREQQQFFNEKMDKRVSNLERWKWILVGGGSVVMFFVMGGQDMLMSFFS